MNNKIILSILIPAYKYKFGIVRLLDEFSNLDPFFKSQIEVIIFDDSENVILKNEEVKFYKDKSLNLFLKNNKFKNGAASNWNSLLASANGIYKWLFHHDEYPVNTEGLIKNIFKIISIKKPKVILLPVFVEKRIFKKIHLKIRINPPRYFLRKICRNPELLFILNVIGSPSVIIVSNDLNYKFDSRFVMLIDVEAFFRIFSSLKSEVDLELINSCDGYLGSELLEGSITHNIKDKIKFIAKEEKKMIFSENNIKDKPGFFIFFGKLIYDLYKLVNISFIIKSY